MGCSAMDRQTPVLTFEVGHNSSGTRRSRMYDSESSELLVARVTGDVVDHPNTVAETFGAAVGERFPDAGQPERFAGVNRGVEVLTHHVLERIEVARGWVAGLGAGDVETDHAPIAVPHGELGDFTAVSSRAHGIGDRVQRERRIGGTTGETGEHRLHDLVECEPCLGVQLGSESNFGVDHAVGSEVLRAFHATRSSASRCCITPHVCAKVSRYNTRSLRLAPRLNHVARSSTSVVGRPA